MTPNQVKQLVAKLRAAAERQQNNLSYEVGEFVVMNRCPFNKNKSRTGKIISIEPDGTYKIQATTTKTRDYSPEVSLQGGNSKVIIDGSFSNLTTTYVYLRKDEFRKLTKRD